MISIINRFLEKRRSTEASEYYLQRARLKTQTSQDLEAKIIEYQGSKYWEVVNVAVKLCGIGRTHRFIPWLTEVVNDPKYVGFVRRNAILTLGEIGVFTESVKLTLLKALSDRYWEVRSQSACVLGLFPAPDKEIELALCSALFGKNDTHCSALQTRPLKVVEKNFEARMHLALSLGKVGDRDALPVLHHLLQDSNWRVRQAVMQGYLSYFRRGLIAVEEIKSELMNLDLAAEGFRPFFEVPSTYNEILKIIGAATAPPENNGSAPNHLANDLRSVRST